jgi:hypothetical protein
MYYQSRWAFVGVGSWQTSKVFFDWHNWLTWYTPMHLAKKWVNLANGIVSMNNFSKKNGWANHIRFNAIEKYILSVCCLHWFSIPTNFVPQSNQSSFRRRKTYLCNQTTVRQAFGISLNFDKLNFDLFHPASPFLQIYQFSVSESNQLRRT